MEPLQSSPQYATARETPDPEHGITPSMLADDAYPDVNDRRDFANYLDAKTICERRLVEVNAETLYGDKEKIHVMRKQYQQRWENYGRLLSGHISYGEFFSSQERIDAASDEEIAAIEKHRDYSAKQRRASVDEACAAAGGRWNGFRCNPVLGDLGRKISCNTDGNTTTCNALE